MCVVGLCGVERTLDCPFNRRTAVRTSVSPRYLERRKEEGITYISMCVPEVPGAEVREEDTRETIYDDHMTII